VGGVREEKEKEGEREREEGEGDKARSQELLSCWIWGVPFSSHVMCFPTWKISEPHPLDFYEDFIT
jgi:hypothetical protein